MPIRKIKRILKGQNTSDGAGVKLVRVFSNNDVKDLDPFLLFDAFDSTNSDDYTNGFPMHPHRGIETVTYLINGEIVHEDSLGNKGSIGAGDCQWMTAGGGILHEEMPKKTDRLFGAQLWVNLPKNHKMTKPKYHDISSNKVPIIQKDGADIRVVAGQYDGQIGAIQSEFVNVTYLDVNVKPAEKWYIDTKAEDTLFIYMLEGQAYFDEEKTQKGSSHMAILFSEGKKLYVNALTDGARFLLISGAKLNEPIAWGGPIVMNTEQEMQQAFNELRDGTFIK